MKNKSLLAETKFTNKDKFQCEGYIFGKQCRQSFTSLNNIKKQPAERIICNL